MFKTPENEEKEVPPPQPITNDVAEEELKPVENVSIPVAEPAVVEQTQQEPEQLEEKATEEVEENKPAQGGYKKKTKRRLTNNRKTKRGKIEDTQFLYL